MNIKRTQCVFRFEEMLLIKYVVTASVLCGDYTGLPISLIRLTGSEHLLFFIISEIL